MPKYKVGDKVVITAFGSFIEGKEATVINVANYTQYGIETVLHSNGHTCDHRGKDGHCWWVDESNLTIELTPLEKKVRAYVDKELGRA